MSQTNEPQVQTETIAGAVKYDSGKAPIYRGAVGYFPRAIEGVAAVSNFGATKYAWNGWRGVPDGLNRYTDAMVRHLAAEAKGEFLDPESRLAHHLHVAWNALARAELIEGMKETNVQNPYLIVGNDRITRALSAVPSIQPQ